MVFNVTRTKWKGDAVLFKPVCPAPPSSRALQAKARTAGKKQCARIQEQPRLGSTEQTPCSSRKLILGSIYLNTGNQISPNQTVTEPGGTLPRASEGSPRERYRDHSCLHAGRRERWTAAPLQCMGRGTKAPGSGVLQL